MKNECNFNLRKNCDEKIAGDKKDHIIGDNLTRVISTLI